MAFQVRAHHNRKFGTLRIPPANGSGDAEYASSVFLDGNEGRFTRRIGMRVLAQLIGAVWMRRFEEATTEILGAQAGEKFAVRFFVARPDRSQDEVHTFEDDALLSRCLSSHDQLPDISRRQPRSPQRLPWSRTVAVSGAWPLGRPGRVTQYVQYVERALSMSLRPRKHPLDWSIHRQGMEAERRATIGVRQLKGRADLLYEGAR